MQVIFDLSYLDYVAQRHWCESFDDVENEYGSISYCTWGVILPMYYNNRYDFYTLCVRRIFAIFHRISRNRILSPSDIDKIRWTIFLSEKRLGSFHHNVKQKIESMLFDRISGILPFSVVVGMLKGRPIQTFYEWQPNDIWRWRMFWDGIAEINTSRRKKLSPNEIEMGVLLTMLGDANAITHYRSQNFWRRQKFNFGNNNEHPRRRA